MTDQEIIEDVKNRMKEQCKRNIDRINQKCAYEGESFSDHKDCFEASKEFLRYGSFPSCYE